MAKSVSIIISAQDNFSAVFQKYQSALGEASTENTRVVSTAGQTASAMDNLSASVTGAIVAYAGMRGIQAVGELFETGQKVDIVSQTFTQLTKNIGGAATNMESLRKSTGGVTDDLTLMQGANKLLQMGLATNSDEMAKLAGMAVKLGSSMGMDATKSMSDFSLMLANNSIMRLDQFGISSGKVRQRMDELKSTMEGIDKNDAFKLAVLEEGQAALDRLGDAAIAAETPLNRLETRMKNFGQQFAGDFATGVNGIAGIIEIATGNTPTQQQQSSDNANAEADATKTAYAYAQRYHDALGEAFQGLDMTGPDLLLKNSMEIINKNPQLDTYLAIMQAMDSLKQSGGGELVGFSDEQLLNMQQVTYGMLKQKDAAEATAKANQDIVTHQAEISAFLNGGGGDDRADSRATQSDAQNLALDGVTGSDLAKTKGKGGEKLKPSEITSAMKADIAAINKDSATAGDHIAKMTDSITKGAIQAEKIIHAFEQLKSVYQLTFKFSADDPDNIIGVIKALQGGTTMADMQRANGDNSKANTQPGKGH